MNDIFKIQSSRYSPSIPNDLQHSKPNQDTFGSYSLQSLGLKIWKRLQNVIKTAENLSSFKHMIKMGTAQYCKYNACQYVSESKSKVSLRDFEIFFDMDLWTFISISILIYLA